MALNEPTLTSRIFDFAARNWGNLASVAGLVASGVSAGFARRASKAAREARQAVLSNTLAEEINISEKLAGEINSLVDLGEHELALFRCGDLRDRTLTILTRWPNDLSMASKNNFLSAKSQLDSLRSVGLKLSETSGSPTTRQRSQMQRTCRTIRDIFVEEHASAMKRKDEVEDE